MKKYLIFATILLISLILFAERSFTEPSASLATVAEVSLTFSDWQKIVSTVWNFEFVTVGDHPISVRSLILAISFFLIGLHVSRRFSKFLEKTLLPKFQMEQSSNLIIKTFSFYILIAFAVFSSLKIAGIPLTIFTVIGGAIALGVGFGSQNLMNNFISGLILMIEMPIKVGDLVEVDGTEGTVEKIGGRSTKIKTPQNTHMIVPNSSFLEKDVKNWTLSDKIMRHSVFVGVAYGSRAREVSKLLFKAADEHGQVLQSPSPKVLFKDFAADSLVFETQFWIKMENIGKREQIESDVRYKIDHLFREGRITIAFPQRDVHLDIEKPITVSLCTQEPSKSQDPKTFKLI